VLAVWIKRTRRILARGTSSLEARRRAWQSARLALRFYEMPFGVFLGGMALLSFLFGNQLLHWYWGGCEAFAQSVVLQMALVAVVACLHSRWARLSSGGCGRAWPKKQNPCLRRRWPPDGMPVHTYHAVIQQLKQQKHELTTQQLADRRKAKASDTLSANRAGQPLLRRAVFQYQRPGAAGEPGSPQASRVRLTRGHAGGGLVPHFEHPAGGCHAYGKYSVEEALALP